MRISYRHQKEAQPEGQHDDIQHGVLLLALVSGRDRCRVPGRKIAKDQEQKSLVVPICEAATLHICFRDGCYGNVIGN